MINIEKKHYEVLARLVAEDIAETGCFNLMYEVEFQEFSLKLKLTACVYGQKTTGGEGREWWEITNIVPVWWEAHTITEDGEKLSDFTWSVFRDYIYQAL